MHFFNWSKNLITHFCRASLSLSFSFSDCLMSTREIRRTFSYSLSEAYFVLAGWTDAWYPDLSARPLIAKRGITERERPSCVTDTDGQTVVSLIHDGVILQSTRKSLDETMNSDEFFHHQCASLADQSTWVLYACLWASEFVITIRLLAEV